MVIGSLNVPKTLVNRQKAKQRGMILSSDINRRSSVQILQDEA